MSAWDVTGAVVWTFLAGLSWLSVPLGYGGPLTTGGSVFAWIFVSSALSFASIFCIARLCGAHT